MEPLDQAVRLGVVGGGVYIFDRQRLPQFRPKRGSELGTAVGGEVGGDAEPGNPTPDERVRACRRGDVLPIKPTLQVLT